MAAQPCSARRSAAASVGKRHTSATADGSQRTIAVIREEPSLYSPLSDAQPSCVALGVVPLQKSLPALASAASRTAALGTLQQKYGLPPPAARAFLSAVLLGEKGVPGKDLRTRQVELFGDAARLAPTRPLVLCTLLDASATERALLPEVDRMLEAYPDAVAHALTLLDGQTEPARADLAAIEAFVLRKEPTRLPEVTELESRSRVPLLVGNVVRLEAHVEKLRDRTITFPPMRLGVEVDRTPIVLEAPLERLEQDSDHDGWTDLVEDRLGLDPLSPDTDHDGVPDGKDDFPNVSQDRKLGATADLFGEFLDELESRPRLQALVEAPHSPGAPPKLGDWTPLADAPDAIRYLVMPRAVAAGLHATSRSLVIEPAELAGLRARFGAFYPMEVDVQIDATGDHALLSWDEAWRGGQMIATRTPAGWVFRRFGEWIT